MTVTATKRAPRSGRRTRRLAAESLVTCITNDSETGLPLVYKAAATQLEPQTWASMNRDTLLRQLDEHGVVLFRDFPIDHSEAFQNFATELTQGLYGQYGDLPKERDNIYHSTPYPEDRMILYHNESSHLKRFPAKQLFFCMQASPIGGATPIADGCEVADILGEETVALFRNKQLRYIRSFLPGLDVSWQEFFKTNSKADVEAHCQQLGMNLEWFEDDGCTIYNQAPAIVDHPVNKRPVFFNQIQLHHPLCLEDSVRDAMQELYGMSRFPRNVTFGDGTPIDVHLIERINQAYETAAKRFTWRNGDVLMLDNTRFAHARDPFNGPRKILVAMADIRESI